MAVTPSVVFIGERPGPATDPLRPLYPHTTTGAAARLIALLGVPELEYLERSDRYNAFHDGEQLLNLTQARERLAEIMRARSEEHPDPRFVFLGAEALRAAPPAYRRMGFLEVRGTALALPHTSGVNRWYNSQANTEAAAAALAAHIGSRLGPRTAPLAAPATQPPASPGPALWEHLRGPLEAVPVPPPPQGLAVLQDGEFEALMQLWYAETMFSSSPTEILAHPAVRRLRADGKLTIDRAVRRAAAGGAEGALLECWLLHKITGLRLGDNEGAGWLARTTLAWMEWYLAKHEQVEIAD